MIHSIDLLAACPPMPGDWPVPADAPPIPDSPLPRIQAELDARSFTLYPLFRQMIDWPGDLRDKRLADVPELAPYWREFCQHSKANRMALHLRGLHQRADWLRTWLDVARTRLEAPVSWLGDFLKHASSEEHGTETTEQAERGNWDGIDPAERGKE